MKILCFGDSITFGEIDTENGGWVDRLKDDFVRKYANAVRQEVTVYNLGICGESTDGLSTRFSVEFNARYVKGQGALVIFAYGANDIVIHKDKNIVPIKYFIRNLENCITFAKSKSANVLLHSVTPIADSSDGVVNQHGKLRYNKDIEAYNIVLKKLAIDFGCHYIDVFSAFNKNINQLLSCDGIHPNSEGHSIIYGLVQNCLDKCLGHELISRTT